MLPPNYLLNKDVSLYIDRVSKFNFKIWKHNRMIDMKRVEAIAGMYRNDAYKTIPGIVYAFRNNDEVVIIDGNHRVQAQKQYKEDMYITLAILETDNEETIFDLYVKINSASPVPELYLQLKNRKPRQICESIVKYYKTKHPDFFSESARPHKPNINEDRFIEKLSEIVKEDSTQEDIIKQLECINLQNKEIYKNAPLKCKKQNFYLFYSDNFTKLRV